MRLAVEADFSDLAIIANEVAKREISFKRRNLRIFARGRNFSARESLAHRDLSRLSAERLKVGDGRVSVVSKITGGKSKMEIYKIINFIIIYKFY